MPLSVVRERNVRAGELYNLLQGFYFFGGEETSFINKKKEYKREYKRSSKNK